MHTVFKKYAKKDYEEYYYEYDKIPFICDYDVYDSSDDEEESDSSDSSFHDEDEW